MSTENVKSTIKGGEFLIRETEAADVFIPEEWNEEQLMIADTCTNFLEQQVLPNLDRIDAQEEGFMEGLLNKAAELGLLGMNVPEKYEGFEKDFVTSFHSFITESPAVENIQLLEGCILWAISRETLTALYRQFHEIETLVRISYEKYYIRLEERYVNAQFKTATERYENLLQDTAHILERVPLGHIASYLGISQETLSRIRSKF